jgi:hypothetical protein
VIYTAIFLDELSQKILLKAFPPIHPKVFGHHVTLAFRPSAELVAKFAPQLGNVVDFVVVREMFDDKGQAVKVTLPAFYDQFGAQRHHVTISCVGSPVYSNELMLQEGRPLENPLHLRGELGHFFGSKK